MRALVMALLVAGTTFAAPGGKKEKEAETHFQKGVELLEAGQFEDALTEFGTAQSLHPTPEAVKYIAECQEALGQTMAAIASYHKYLDDVAVMVTETPEVHALRKHLGDLQAKFHADRARELRQQRKYGEAIDEFHEAQKARTDAHVWYEIAMCWEEKGNTAHAVEFYQRYLQEKPDASDAGEVEGRIAVLSGKKLVAPPPVEEVKEKPVYVQSPWYRSGPGWALTVVGLLLGGAGGALLGLSTAAANDLDRLTHVNDFLATMDRGQTMNKAGIAVTAVGGAALLTGIVLFVVHTRPRLVEKPAAARDPLAPAGTW
jgi:tetratricopeptide (TPR) repeat protein